MLQEKIKQDPEVYNFISKLNELTYNFETKKLTIQQNTIDNVLKGIFFYRQCMGAGGDQLIESAYGTIISLHPNIDFDKYIAIYLPEILNMEKIAVNNLLDQYLPKNEISQEDPEKSMPLDTDTKLLIDTLEERRIALSGPTPELPPFNPDLVSYNPHTA